jgi:hypothetical protein
MERQYRYVPTWLLGRQTDQSMMIPDGYGVAWRNYQTGYIVVAPLILNTFIAVMRRLYFWIKYDCARGA